MRGDPADLEKLDEFGEELVSGTAYYYLWVMAVQLLFDEERGKYRPYNEAAEAYYNYKRNETQIHLDFIRQGIASEERLQKLHALEKECPVYYGMNDAGNWGFWYKSPENLVQDSKEVKAPDKVATQPKTRGVGGKYTRTERGIACDVCGEQYSIAQVKNALETGRMKCSCGNNLTKTAKTLLDKVEGD